MKTAGILFTSDISEHVICNPAYNTRYEVKVSLTKDFTDIARSTWFTTPSQLPAPPPSSRPPVGGP